MISLEQVTKVYESRRLFGKRAPHKAVDSLSLEIPAGIFGLLGVNGAGKSTTLKMIATLLHPTSGRILIEGKDSVKDEKPLRRRINMITGSDRMLYFRLTGRENLSYFAALYGLGYRETKRRVDFLLDLTGLSAAAGQRVEQYSRGMKQRLSIARGLINDPSVLLLDEPTLGLDVEMAHEIRRFIKNELAAARKGTIILTSHYMQEIEAVCPRLGILQHGKLIFQGRPEELYERMGLRTRHLFSYPADEELPAELSDLIGGAATEVAVRGGQREFLVPGDRAYALLGGMERLQAFGLGYRQEEPGLEEAILKLGKETAPC